MFRGLGRSSSFVTVIHSWSGGTLTPPKNSSFLQKKEETTSDQLDLCTKEVTVSIETLTRV